MADNYLEKQYAEYEARKAAWEKARKLGTTKKKTTPTAQQLPQPDEKPRSTTESNNPTADR